MNDVGVHSDRARVDSDCIFLEQGQNGLAETGGRDAVANEITNGGHASGEPAGEMTRNCVIRIMRRGYRWIEGHRERNQITETIIRSACCRPKLRYYYGIAIQASIFGGEGREGRRPIQVTLWAECLFTYR